MSIRRPLVLSVALLLTGLHFPSRPLAAPRPSDTSQAAPAQPPAPATAAAGNLERGRYIAENVAMCIECHSGRDASGQIVPGREYLGGTIPFSPPWSNDWATAAPRNAGLPGYTDAAAMRLLTRGSIGRLGVRLRAPMPAFRMTPQDAADVIAYLRSR